MPRFYPSPIVFRLLMLALLLLLALQAAFSGQRVEAQSDPAVVGQWGPVQSWPLIAIDATLLPNGKVLVWPRNRDAQAKVWNPITGLFENAPLPTTDLFCSGHSLLADGRVLVTGGHNISDGIGLAHTNLFDWRTNTWSRAGDMNAGRWYPTNCMLPNGEVVVLSGSIDNNVGINMLPQVWNATTGWRDLTNGELSVPLYPFLHVAPNGKVFMSGPGETTRYLDTNGLGTWSVVGDSQNGFRDYGTSVMYDPGKVLLVGGHDPPLSSAEVIDLNDSAPAWRPAGNMAHARRQLNGALLPDGTVLITGGTSGAGFNNAPGSVYAAERWDPTTERFTTLASMAVRRLYHSVSLLLPDGRVLSAGGGQPAGSDGDEDHSDAEIFSPPYLFQGERPTVTEAPERVTWGETFLVRTPDAASIRKVNWISLGSVTHANNMNQRFNRLAFTATTEGLNITAPANANLCVPGYYMLFLLNERGVPSVARMIRIDTAVGESRYRISGKITLDGNGLAGVTVTSGEISATTDANGAYRLENLAAGSYTLTPEKSGYRFAPTSRTVSVTTADVTSVDFAASVVKVTYSISGIVTLNGVGLSGVTVRAGGVSARTSSAGNYTLLGLPAGTYTVTPTRTDYTFNPGIQSVRVVAQNVTGVNFAAFPAATYRISGRITANGNVLANVTISAGPVSTTTGTDGSYALADLKPGVYSVVPILEGYTFTPSSRSVTLTTANASGINFSGNAATYSLSGTVLLGSSGLAGVRVTAGDKSATTSALGAYSISGLRAGTYTVTPSREGYGFFPPNRSLTLTGNSAGQNFTAQVVTTLIAVRVSKSIVKGKKPLTGTVIFNRKVITTTAVTLAGSHSAARVPPSIQVKKGKKQATFSITTQKVGVPTLVTITARMGASTKTAQLTVKP